jgi:hypothetical protein
VGEIGAGSGSSYPATLDTDTVQETATDYARIAVPNDLAAAIIAIETELGVDPAGSFATVVARLNQISNATGGGVTRGLNSARPAASAGVWFYNTDSGILEFSTGSAWIPVAAG